MGHASSTARVRGWLDGLNRSRKALWLLFVAPLALIAAVFLLTRWLGGIEVGGSGGG